jgi:hypothetical protein
MIDLRLKELCLASMSPAEINIAEMQLKGEIARLTGLVEGLTICEREGVWRRAYIEKLLMMEGYDRQQICDFICKVKPNGEAQPDTAS